MITFHIASFYGEFCVYAARDGVRIPGTTTFHRTEAAAKRAVAKRQRED